MWGGTSPPGVTRPGRKRDLEEAEEALSLNKEREGERAGVIRNKFLCR